MKPIPQLTQAEREDFPFHWEDWMLMGVIGGGVIGLLLLCFGCTIVPKENIPSASTGEWLHAGVYAGQSGQEATQQARDKWLTLLPAYGRYLLPALTPAQQDKGWTRLADGNWFVTDNAVTAYGMMNFYFLNPGDVPKAP